jgi:hypothetical protein
VAGRWLSGGELVASQCLAGGWLMAGRWVATNVRKLVGSYRLVVAGSWLVAGWLVSGCLALVVGLVAS